MQLNSFCTKICVFLVAVFISPLISHGQWTNGQAADQVYGQASYTTNSTGNGLNNLLGPVSVVVDPTSKKVFINDFQRNRILRFSSYETYSNGAAAEMALTNISNEGSSTLNSIAGLCIENGNLWIADGGSHRVLRIPNASTMTDGATANLVLGQTNFTTKTSGQTIDKLTSPNGIFFKENTLWVSQLSGHKIFRFDNISGKSNGASADAYLGNLNGTTGASATTFSSPRQVYVDIQNNLWVADGGNHRVLKFENAKTFVSSAAASLVLGQPDFTTAATPTNSSKSLRDAYGVYGDAFGNIYVGQNVGRRVTVFKNGVNIIENNVDADFVIGQPDFTNLTSQRTASTLNGGAGHLFVDNYLWVPDIISHRVLRFSPLYSLPVTLTNFTAKTETGNKVILNWTTTSETNNSHFVIQKSVNGSTWTDVAKVASKAEKGNSSVPLNYTLSLPLGELALAGFGLLGLLLLPATRNRYLRFAVVLLVIGSIAGCAKTDDTTNQLGEDLKSGQAIYVRIAQVDLDGTTTYSDAIAVKK
ncbi:NHL repeat protein [compost metagenome]